MAPQDLGRLGDTIRYTREHERRPPRSPNTRSSKAMTKILVTIAALLAASALTVLLYHSPQNRISRLLGGHENVSIISECERGQLFQTTFLLARLTNGPLPEEDKKIGRAVVLPAEAIQPIQKILLNPETYSEDQASWQGTGIGPPELILTLTRGRKTIELAFAEDFREISLKREGARSRKLMCQPGRHVL